MNEDTFEKFTNLALVLSFILAFFMFALFLIAEYVDLYQFSKEVTVRCEGKQ